MFEYCGNLPFTNDDVSKSIKFPSVDIFPTDHEPCKNLSQNLLASIFASFLQKFSISSSVYLSLLIKLLLILYNSFSLFTH
mgnify:CR=1 FL=1